MRKTFFNATLVCVAMITTLFMVPVQQLAAISGEMSSTNMPTYSSSYSFADKVRVAQGEYGGGGVDADGNTYVSNVAETEDGTESFILKHSPTGEFVDKIFLPSDYEVQPHNGVNIVIDDADNLYVAAYRYDSETTSNISAILKIDQNGTLLETYGEAVHPSTGKRIGAVYGLAVDSKGHVYVSDTGLGEAAGHQAVVKFNADGTYAAVGTQIHESLEGGAGFYSLDVDVQDNLYVRTGLDAQRIVKFSPSGQELQTYAVAGADQGMAENAILTHAVDDNGAIYTLHFTEEYAVYLTKIAASGEFIGAAQIQPDGAAAFESSSGTIDINQSGEMFIYDGWGKRGFTYQVMHNQVAFDATGNNRVESTMTLGDRANIISADARTAEAQNAAVDGNNTYPLGFVSFVAEVSNGATTTVSIVQVTDLMPDQVKARKYNTSTRQYSDVPAAAITETTVDGKHALQLTYPITDGGVLDQDGVANGRIVDPVGLALLGGTTTTPGGDDSQPLVPGAPSTGVGKSETSPILFVTFLLFAAIIGMTTIWITRQYIRQRLSFRRVRASRKRQL